MKLTLIAVFFIWISFTVAFGQMSSTDKQSNGKLSGTIFDSNKAVIPATKIIIEGKGFNREIIADLEGSYQINIPEGKYKIKVEHDWFYPFKKKNVRVNSNDTTKLDITLKVRKRVDESHP